MAFHRKYCLLLLLCNRCTTHTRAIAPVVVGVVEQRFARIPKTAAHIVRSNKPGR